MTGKTITVSTNGNYEALLLETIPGCFWVAVATEPVSGRMLLLRIEGSPACTTDALPVDAEDIRRQRSETWAWAYYCQHRMDLPLSGLAGWSLEIVHESPVRGEVPARRSRGGA